MKVVDDLRERPGASISGMTRFSPASQPPARRSRYIGENVSCAGFVGLFNLMGPTMAVATPVVLAVFGGATVVSLLKGPSSELPK